jgi:hypothetical protein
MGGFGAPRRKMTFPAKITVTISQLPRIAPGFSAVAFGKRQEFRTQLDTVLVNAIERRVELTWRVAIPMPKKLEMLERILVFEKKVI